MASIGNKKSKETAKRGITRNSIRDGEVTAPKLHPDVLSGDHFLYRGKGQPLLLLADMSAVASGADATEHIAVLPGGGILHYAPIAAAVVLGPIANANGLELSLDDTNNDGCNYIPGGLLGAGRMVVERTAGAVVSKGRFIRFRGIISDVSGTDDFAIGFRKSEAVQAAVDDYDEMAAVNVISGDVKIETILNNAATVTLDSGVNWADGEEHEVEVRVDGAGNVTYRIDGVKIGVPFQFDDNEVIVPFLYFIDAADLTELYCTKLEVGTLEHV